MNDLGPILAPNLNKCVSKILQIASTMINVNPSTLQPFILEPSCLKLGWQDSRKYRVVYFQSVWFVPTQTHIGSSVPGGLWKSQTSGGGISVAQQLGEPNERKEFIMFLKGIPTSIKLGFQTSSLPTCVAISWRTDNGPTRPIKTVIKRINENQTDKTNHMELLSSTIEYTPPLQPTDMNRIRYICSYFC